MGDGLFCWNDRATWAPLLDKPERALQTPETSLAALLESYAGLKVFHACRTADVNTYLREGLRPRMIAELNEAARNIAHEFDASVLDGDIDCAIARVPFSIEGSVYASVDRRELQGHVHFFRYGSERVYLILMRLGELNGWDYLQQLEAIGRPIMLDLAIPWQDVSQWLRGKWQTRSHRVGAMCERVASRTCDNGRTPKTGQFFRPPSSRGTSYLREPGSQHGCRKVMDAVCSSDLSGLLRVVIPDSSQRVYDVRRIGAAEVLEGKGIGRIKVAAEFHPVFRV